MNTGPKLFPMMWSAYATVIFFLLTGALTLIFHPSSIDYIVSNDELSPLPWGACCALKGPVSDLLGLEAVVALLYLEMLVVSPLSILAGVLIWRLNKAGAILGICLSVVRTGITLIGFAVPIGIIFILPLLLLRRLWAHLR